MRRGRSVCGNEANPSCERGQVESWERRGGSLKEGDMDGKIARLVLGAILLASAMMLPDHGFAGDESKTADLLIKLLKTGRSVISDNQALINDPTKGDKGFTHQYLETQIIERYKVRTGIDLTKMVETPRAKLLLLLLESQKEVVQLFQPVINFKGLGFKGVLPAKFARMSGERFYQKTGIKLRLTSLDYRFPGNAPDDFEAEVLRLFGDPRYPKGKDFKKMAKMADQRVLRVMSPEYAKTSCLKCHGTPKGEKDITGGKKEGWHEGDLGGAISVVISLN